MLGKRRLYITTLRQPESLEISNLIPRARFGDRQNSLLSFIRIVKCFIIFTHTALTSWAIVVGATLKA